MVAFKRSGYIVGLWLPQTVKLFIYDKWQPDFSAIWKSALLWSSLIIAVKLVFGILLALELAIKALVLAGLPTTRILQSAAAFSSIALPYSVNILPLSFSKSPLSIPNRKFYKF